MTLIEIAGHHHHFVPDTGHPTFPVRAAPFILRHVRHHRWLFGACFA